MTDPLIPLGELDKFLLSLLPVKELKTLAKGLHRMVSGTVSPIVVRIAVRLGIDITILANLSPEQVDALADYKQRREQGKHGGTS